MPDLPVMRKTNYKILIVLFFLLACSSSTFDQDIMNAEAKIGLNDTAGALKIYRHIAEKYPNDKRRPEVLVRIARVQNIFLGDYASAAKSYSRVIGDYPESKAAIDAREERAELYHKMGDMEGAVEDISTLIKRFPDNADKYRLMLARMYMATKEYVQARVELAQVIKSKTVSKNFIEEAAFMYAESYFLTGDTDAAAGWLDAFIKEFPKSEYIDEAKLHLATCLEETGKLGAAKTVMEDVKNYPNQKVIDSRMKSMEGRGTKDERGTKQEVRSKK